MIDEENWDGDKDPIVRTKWFNKYGRRHVSRQTMFRMLQKTEHTKSVKTAQKTKKVNLLVKRDENPVS